MTEENKTEKPVVLITGASGLIGTRVCNQLENEYQLVGMDLKDPSDGRLPLHHIDTDLTDEQNVKESLREVKENFGNRIASVLHLAAYYDFSGEPSPMYESLTVEGTRRLLQLLHELEFKVEQFVFSSSLLVMKPGEEELTEYSETRAEWAYPKSKLEAEAAIREEHGDIPFVLLRIAGVYDEQCHSLPISQQISRIYEKQMESYVFPGDPSHGQALIHLNDLAACFEKVVEHREALPEEEMFLIAEPKPMSYEQLQDEIGKLIHGEEWPAIRIPKFVAKSGARVKNWMSGDDDQPFIKPWMVDLADANYDVDLTHTREQLDWEPDHRLQDVVPQMIAFLKQNPADFYRTNKLPVPEDIKN